MRPIDEYIVRMQLDNEKFKRNATETVGIFEKMKSLFSKETPATSLSSIGEGLDTLVGKFDSSSVMFRRVLENMVDGAIGAGRKMASAITTPLVEAGKRRALSIEQAQFQFQGLGMDVEATMQSANQAVLGTAFGLDEAAMAAAMFGASGMRAGDEMTTALRGISGVAAMTGSAYSDISNVFTSVAGNGRLMGNDLLRLSTRGVNAAATLADAMDTTESAVREMVTAGEIDFETFAKAMDDAFGEHATKSSETFKGALSLVNSAIQRIGATMFAQGFVDKKNLFNAMTPQVNKLHEALKPLINTFNEYKTLVTGRLIVNIERLNLDPLVKSTKAFVDQGGMGVITDSIEALGRTAKVVFRSMKTAMSNIFDGPSVASSISFLEGFKNVFESIENTITRNADNIKSAFEGIFAIMDLGWYVVKELAGVFVEVFPGGLVDNAFDIAGGFGEIAKAFATSVKEGSVLPAILDGIGGALSIVKVGIEGVGKGIKFVFEGVRPALEFVWNLLKEIGKFAKGFVGEIFGGFDGVDLLTIGAAGGILSIVKRIGGFMDKVLELVGDNGIAGSLSEITGSFTGLIDGVTDSLSAMTQSIKAKTLITIASAVGILAVSLKLLEGMDAKDIVKSLGAVSGSMIAMVLAMKYISGLDMTGLKSVKTATTLLGLATATVILAKAVKILSEIEQDDMEKGLGAMMASILGLVGTMRLLSGVKGVETGAVKMIAIAVAVRILVSAIEPLTQIDSTSLMDGILGLGIIMLELAAFIKIVNGSKINLGTAAGIAIVAGAITIMVNSIGKMGDMDTVKLIDGILALGAVLGSIAVFTRVVNPKGMITAGIGMTIISGALLVMTSAVDKMGSIDTNSIIKGLGGLAVILGEVILFTKMINPGKLLGTSAGLVVMAAAMNLLVPPIVKLGEMSNEGIIKGITGLGVALVAIAVAMDMAATGLPGAIATTVMAGALMLIITPIKTLGEMDMDHLVQGLLGIAGVMLIMGGMAAILGPLSPVIMAFATSLLVTAAAVTLAALGFSAIAIAITAMAEVSTAALDSIVQLLVIFVDGLAEILPKVVTLILEGITQIVVGIAENAPILATAIADLIIGMLTVISEKTPEFIEVAVDIILALIEGIDSNAERLAIAGTELIITLIDAMSLMLETYAPTLIASILRLVGEILIVIVEAGTQVITALFGWIPGVNSAMDWVGENATNAIREAFGAGEVATEKGQEFASGIEGSSGDADTAGGILGGAALTGIEGIDFAPGGTGSAKGYLQGLSDEEMNALLGGKALSKQGFEGTKDTDFSPAGRQAGQGFISGLSAMDLLSGVWTAGKNLASRALSAMKATLDTGSPSRKTAEIGGWFGEGLIIGMKETTRGVGEAGVSLAQQALDSLKSKAELFSELLNKELDLAPTITPILDLGNFNTSELDSRFDNYASSVNSRAYRSYKGVDPRNNQNDYNLNNNDSNNTIPAPTVEYHAHLTAQGSLPKSTIERMAKDFDTAIKDMEDKNKSGRGESVFY